MRRFAYTYPLRRPRPILISPVPVQVPGQRRQVRQALQARGIHRNERARLSFEVLRIHFSEMCPLLRQIIQREDGRNRADWHARTTIDAFNWVDVELRHGVVIHLVLLRVDAVNRAGIHTRCVFRADARLGNNVRHFSIPTFILR